MTNLILPIIFIILQLNDVITTALILKHGGRELNPFVSWFITRFGSPLEIILPKLPVIAAISYTSLTGIFPTWLLAFMCAAYLLVIVSNLRVLEKLYKEAK